MEHMGNNSKTNEITLEEYKEMVDRVSKADVVYMVDYKEGFEFGYSWFIRKCKVLDVKELDFKVDDFDDINYYVDLEEWGLDYNLAVREVIKRYRQNVNEINAILNEWYVELQKSEGEVLCSATGQETD